MRKAILGFAAISLIVLGGCGLVDGLQSMANITKVDFSDAGWSTPSVSCRKSTAELIYAVTFGNGISLDDFLLNVTYNVRADNSGNSGTAAFGSEYAKPVLNFYVGDTTISTGKAFHDTIPAFSIKGGSVDTIKFTTAIPFSWFKNNAPKVATSLVNGTDIPYRLTAQLAFHVTLPTGSLSAGTSELDIGRGGVATRPDALIKYGSQILSLF